MKIIQTTIWVLALLTLFTSCQSTSSKKINLSNKDTRIEIMNAIAYDSIMSQEMIDAMMNNKNSIKMMRDIR